MSSTKIERSAWNCYCMIQFHVHQMFYAMTKLRMLLSGSAERKRNTEHIASKQECKLFYEFTSHLQVDGNHTVVCRWHSAAIRQVNTSAQFSISWRYARLNLCVCVCAYVILWHNSVSHFHFRSLSLSLPFAVPLLCFSSAFSPRFVQINVFIYSITIFVQFSSIFLFWA